MGWWITFSTTPAGSQDLTTGQLASTFHNFAQAIIVPRFGIGLNIGTNNGGGLSESRQSTGFSKTLSWIFEHLAGKHGVNLSSVAVDNSFMGLDMANLKRTTFA